MPYLRLDEIAANMLCLNTIRAKMKKKKQCKEKRTNEIQSGAGFKVETLKKIKMVTQTVWLKHQL